MVKYFYNWFVVITILFQTNDWQLSTWQPVQRAAPLMQSITFFFRTSNSASDGVLRKNSNSVSSGIMLGSTPPLRITPDNIELELVGAETYLTVNAWRDIAFNDSKDIHIKSKQYYLIIIHVFTYFKEFNIFLCIIFFMHLHIYMYHISFS